MFDWFYVKVLHALHQWTVNRYWTRYGIHLRFKPTVKRAAAR